MAILDQTELTPDRLAEAGPEGFAFLLKNTVDLTYIDNFRKEALGFADWLNNPTGDGLPSDILENAMAKALKGLEDAVTTNNGSLIIIVPENFGSFSSHFPAVSNEYEVQFYEHRASRVLLVPTAKITAAKALSYPSSPVSSKPSFEPCINLRIQTPTDSPVSYYAAPGAVELVPNVGRWLNLPLENIKLAFLPDY